MSSRPRDSSEKGNGQRGQGSTKSSKSTRVVLDSSAPNKWACLPAVALRMIYSYVPRKEQAYMSVVCRNWMNEYDSPTNWRNLQFFFPEGSFNAEFLPSVRFARRYAHLIKEVDIACLHKCKTSLSRAIKQFELFVDAIHERSRLQTVTFTNLKHIVSRLDRSMLNRLLEGIWKIFNHQSTITTVEFKLCSFTTATIDKTFSRMFAVSSSPIVNLKMWKMHCQRQYDVLLPFGLLPHNPTRPYDWILKFLLRVEKWDTDYCHFVEKIVLDFSRLTSQQFADCGCEFGTTTGSLKKLILKYEGWAFGGLSGITPQAWTAFCKFLPDLEIHMSIGPSVDARRSLGLLLSSRIPLRALYFKTTSRQFGQVAFEANVVFDHLCNKSLNLTLRDFRLCWAGPSSSILRDLNNFLNNCPGLKTVDLQVVFPLPDLHNMLESWILDRPLHLAEMFLTVKKIPSEQTYSQMSSMGSYYTPILGDLGIKFVLTLQRSTDFDD